ncbi:MAG: LPS translocon maturation chaperone LptM [Pseudomonadota bacterium]
MRICWAQYALWAVIAALGVMAMLAGCGAKGELYLPPEQEQSAALDTAPFYTNRTG